MTETPADRPSELDLLAAQQIALVRLRGVDCAPDTRVVVLEQMLGDTLRDLAIARGALLEQRADHERERARWAEERRVNRTAGEQPDTSGGVHGG